MKLNSVSLLLLYGCCCSAFTATTQTIPQTTTSSTQLWGTSTSSTNKNARRTGLGQSLLNFALNSPLWTYVLVPQARQKMVDTAASNGIPWEDCKQWMMHQMKGNVTTPTPYSNAPPSYYQQPFHAYPDGNLCWDAAYEAEIASAAVGARNFPDYGREGETAFRNAFSACLDELGATVPEKAVIVDLGCSTGLSTRRLGEQYPQASNIIGLDLSPYFVKVAQRLMELAPIPSILQKEEGWINVVQPDARIDFRVGAAEDTKLPDNSVDVVNLQFVAHELPLATTLAILKESHRILKPGGQLWFCEMDFETPGYAAQRSNPLLFSLIRSTEPYLDEYAEHAEDIRSELRKWFHTTRMGAATGRHFAVVAVKNDSSSDDDEESSHTFHDLRWDSDGNYAVDDTHLKVWENKK
mmetsp:Transcript_8157/g.12508  ORF Transcript_8157/g.12508 Transcript_8157/m.12508 type:complete len:410 (+) Transcript_8157:60-1289(+)